MLKTFIGLLLIMMQVIFLQISLAKNLYHCGNSYQDTPCKGEVSGKSSSNTSIPSTKNTISNNDQPTQNIDLDCKQRGDVAKKIMWAREGGKTAEQQIETAQDGDTQTLIKDVYNRRGSSLEVKNAIEQDCMLQKEQDKLADKMMIEAQRLRKSKTGSSAADIPSNNSQSDSASTTTKVNGIENKTNHDGNPAQCVELKSNADDLTTRRRQGGNASYMNKLKQQLDALERKILDKGC
jgi:hypothetical protein